MNSKPLGRLPFLLLQRLGWASADSLAARALLGAASRARVAIRGGGLCVVPDDEVFARVLARVGRAPSGTVNGYLAELAGDRPLRSAFERATAEGKVTKYRTWNDRLNRLRGNVAIFYALLRELRPAVIVETGTAGGSMTSLMLTALARNGAGRLISVDLPAKAGQFCMDVTIPADDVGYLIPSEYRDRWEYVRGDAKVELPRILANEAVDVFVHDSLHTRTHMMFEYAVARALMRPGALLISDDVLWNSAFDGFAAGHGLTAFVPATNPNIGVTVNEFSAEEQRIGLGIVMDRAPAGHG